MSLALTSQILTPRETLSNLHELYAASPQAKKFNLLLIGRVGSGKTTLVSTAPKPILIDAFDPNVSKSLARFKDDPNYLINTKFLGDDIGKPRIFTDWVRETQERETAGIFKMIGTYVIDSGTVWANSLKNQILAGSPGPKKGGGKRERQTNGLGLPEMEIDDYDTLFTKVWDVVNRLCALPCNFILTFHLEEKTNDFGGIVNRLAIPGQSRDKLPILFDELWRARTTNSSAGLKYDVQTVTDAGFECRTCLGAGGKLLPYETPDIKAILRKCGWPADDKEV